MKKFKYVIFGISYAYGTNNNVLILSDLNEQDRKLPIIIGEEDAKFISLSIENVDVKNIPNLKQNTYIKLIDTFGYTVNKIYIHSVVEGKFYCKVYMNNGIEEKEIDLSISDAVSLSLLYKSKIYVSEEVVNSSTILMNDNGLITPEQDSINKETKSNISTNGNSNIENLQMALDKAVEEQDYETAAKIRDKIQNIQNIS